MQRRFRKNITSLEAIFTFIEDFFGRHQVAAQHRFPVNLVVEELFTNMVKYNRESNTDILIALNCHHDTLIGSLTDFDATPVEIPPDTDTPSDLPLEQRQVGGLGLHLVRRMVDQLYYSRDDRQNKVTFIRVLR